MTDLFLYKNTRLPTNILTELKRHFFGSVCVCGGGGKLTNFRLEAVTGWGLIDLRSKYIGPNHKSDLRKKFFTFLVKLASLHNLLKPAQLTEIITFNKNYDLGN